MESVPFAGWNRNARLTFGSVEVVVTLEVGPRILGLSIAGGENFLAVHSATAGRTGDPEFHSYGGHRLWVAPEVAPRTTTPDNESVEYSQEGPEHVFRSKPDRFSIQKEMRVSGADGGGICLRHRVHNLGGYAVSLAPWTPTQFAPGGRLYVPQASRTEQAGNLVPARPIVFWSYTSMADPRYTWGDRLFIFTWRDLPPTKIGSLITQGFAAYANKGSLFIKRFAYAVGADYPDMGCNFELYSRPDVVEIESLGPMQTVEPGAFVEHWETWYVIPDWTAPSDEAECAAVLAELVVTRPLVVSSI